MDALANLEYLSLVQSTMNELVNHLGDDCGDKTLAEFIVSMHEEATDAKNFKLKLQEIGGDQFSDSLISNLNRLISTMHPKYKKKNGIVNGDSISNSKAKAMSESAVRISALSLPDGAKWQSVEEIVEEEQREKRALLNGKKPKDVDDLMSQLENVGEKRRSMAAPSSRDSHDRSPKRSRRVSVSPPRTGNGRSKPDEKPVLFKIYNGRITGVRDFGAFVALEGIAGRAEGEFAFLQYSAIGN